jgi:tetratricopeptide (TPR) repeat protein
MGSITAKRISSGLRAGAALTLLALFSAPPRAEAHADLLAQIAEVTRQIEKTPGQAELFLRRAELYRLHQTWDSAYVDYERAAALDPNLAAVDLGRGKLFLEANWPLSAKAALDRLLRRQTNNVEGFITRAHVFLKLGQPLEAAQDFTRAIRLSPEGRPELYIERSQALSSAGPTHLEAAVQGLEEGMQKLGPLITLQLYAIDIEMRRSRFDAALSRLDKVMAQSPRKETWLARRGEILQQAGQSAEAAEAFQAALKAMDTLPASRRHVPAMIELEKRLRAALEASKETAKAGTAK